EERDHVELTWAWFTYESIGYYVYTSSTPSMGNPGGGSVATADAWRLLNQATFGASQGEAARVASLGIAGWIDDQFAQPISGYPFEVQQDPAHANTRLHDHGARRHHLCGEISGSDLRAGSSDARDAPARF